MNNSCDEFSYEDLPEDFTSEGVCTLRVKSCPNLSNNMNNNPLSCRKLPQLSKEVSPVRESEKPKNSL